MAQDLISKKTRQEFREYFVCTTLRIIADEFDAADVECDRGYTPPESGARRSFVEQYYHSIDFTDWEQAQKVLKVFENVLVHLSSQEDDWSKERVAKLQKWIEKDGYNFTGTQILSKNPQISANPIKAIADEYSADYLSQMSHRMMANIHVDPALTIGTAKEMIETCCKTILRERGKPVQGNPDIPALTKTTLTELKLVPEGVSNEVRGSDAIKQLLRSLSSVAHTLTEIRGLYGTGHGQDGRSKGLYPRHAKLAATSSIAFVEFLFETHKEKAPKKENSAPATS